MWVALQVDMKKNNPGQDEQLKMCWSTMLKYIGNIARVSGAASVSFTICCTLEALILWYNLVCAGVWYEDKVQLLATRLKWMMQV